MAIEKFGSAKWSGGLKDGKGAISTESGALKEHPYGFKTRFEGVAGSNPEELIGAAHAACFTMALSKALGDAGFTADSLETRAKVTLSQTDGGFEISGIALTLTGAVPGTDEATFRRIAEEAKVGCPVSKALKAVPITLETSFR